MSLDDLIEMFRIMWRAGVASLKQRVMETVQPKWHPFEPCTCEACIQRQAILLLPLEPGKEP